jgi:hypothetical protein
MLKLDPILASTYQTWSIEGARGLLKDQTRKESRDLEDSRAAPSTGYAVGPGVCQLVSRPQCITPMGNSVH